MRRLSLIVLLAISTCWAFAQQVETARYEVTRWGKNQGIGFVSFKEQGGMMVTETEKIDDKNNRLWNFITLDTSLYELKSDLIPLPDHLALFGAESSDSRAAFVFVNEKQHKADSVTFWVVAHDHVKQSYNSFFGRLPERATLHAMALVDGTLMLSVNGKSGDGFLLQYDLDNNNRRTIMPAIGNDYVMFQLEAVPEAGLFVLVAREFVEKHYRTTCFFVYSKDGHLLQSHRFENGENASLGRMCFSFDDALRLTVYATLERETNRRINADDMTEDFSREAVGVTWIKFAGTTLTKTYLFKNLPDIDQALTSSDRLRVREEMLKMQQGKQQERGEVAFQFYTPRLVTFGETHVMAAEAFMPVFHTETRMEYGYYSFYGTYPVSYVVFDGYDFFSEILLAFDDDGEMMWHNTVRFENELCDVLSAHALESVTHDELVVCSPSRNTMRYEVFDVDGSRLLTQQTMPMDFLYRADAVEEEFDAGMTSWYGDRFLVSGCQMVQNPALRNTHRIVFYIQKIQYE